MPPGPCPRRVRARARRRRAGRGSPRRRRTRWRPSGRAGAARRTGRPAGRRAGQPTDLLGAGVEGRDGARGSAGRPGRQPLADPAALVPGLGPAVVGVVTGGGPAHREGVGGTAEDDEVDAVGQRGRCRPDVDDLHGAAAVGQPVGDRPATAPVLPQSDSWTTSAVMACSSRWREWLGMGLNERSHRAVSHALAARSSGLGPRPGPGRRRRRSRGPGGGRPTVREQRQDLEHRHRGQGAGRARPQRQTPTAAITSRTAARSRTNTGYGVPPTPSGPAHCPRGRTAPAPRATARRTGRR